MIKLLKLAKLLKPAELAKLVKLLRLAELAQQTSLNPVKSPESWRARLFFGKILLLAVQNFFVLPAEAGRPLVICVL